MEARYAIRKRQLLDECQVVPEIFEHVIPRLYSFMKPFVTIFQGQVPINTPKPMSVVFCRTLNAKTSNRLPIALATLACPCKPSLAGTSGTMSPYDLSCDIKSRPTWDKAMGCRCLIPRDFPSPAASRSVWPDSGVAVGQSRQLPSGHLFGLRLQKGPHLG